MNINKINNYAFGRSIFNTFNKKANEANNESAVKYKTRPTWFDHEGQVEGKFSLPTKPYDFELMGVNVNDNRITINVVDPQDEVILSCLDTIAQRNKELVKINANQEYYNNLLGIKDTYHSARAAASFFAQNGYGPIYEE